MTFNSRLFAGPVMIIAIGQLVESLVFQTLERLTVRHRGVWCQIASTRPISGFASQACSSSANCQLAVAAAPQALMRPGTSLP